MITRSAAAVAALTTAGFVAVSSAASAGASTRPMTTTYTYVVNSAADARDTNLLDAACDNTCTLRGAIEQANHNCIGSPGVSTTIDFAIPGTGVRTITPVNDPTAGNNQAHAAPLPHISCPVVIDGSSQGGAGYTGTPLIELDGSNATAAGQQGPGLGFGANPNGSTVRGLVINRWLGPGISFAGPGGGSAAGFAAYGNYVGTDATGTLARPNGAYDGIWVSGNASATIGGTAAGQRNVISGNGNRGVFFGPGAVTGSIVAGNYIGTDLTGTKAVPNASDGIQLNGNNGAVIGGTAAGAGNVISGNKGNGISVGGSGVGSMTIQGNRIGTQVNGRSAVANKGYGVAFQGTGGHDLLGGTTVGAANVIAFNKKAGVLVSNGTTHRISRNSVFKNAKMGIDLTPCTNGACPGPTPNDATDVDTGANLLQNFPVITSVARTSAGSTISGTLTSTAGSSFTVEVFSTATCDASGYGQGQKYLGTTTVATSAGGSGSFSLAVASVGTSASVTATATDAAGNTSEFSPCRGPLTLSPSTGPAGTAVSVSGHGFAAGTTVTLLWNCPVTTCTTGTITLGTATTSTSGTFSGTTVTVPASAKPGTYWIGARTAKSFATVPFTVG